MAADTQSTSSDDQSDGAMGPISAINVTPFVDVVLVLLVIFMITAPALVQDTLGIKLPKAASTEKSVGNTIGIVVTQQGQVLFNGEVVTAPTLKTLIATTLAKDPEAQAVITADHQARHGDVVKAIDWVKAAGIKRFAFQIERTSDTP